MQIYPPRPRRRLPVAQPSPTVDRYALGLAVFGALTFVATLTLVCAVFALGAVVLRSETRWAELADLLGAPPPLVSPLAPPADQTAPTVEAPTASPIEVLEPTLVAAQSPSEPSIAPTMDSPLDTPVPGVAPTPTEFVPTEAVIEPPPPPEQAPSPEELAAQSLLLQQADRFSIVLSALMSLLAVPAPDDANWQGQVTDQVTAFRQTYNELFSTPPPPILAPAYGVLTTAADSCLTGIYTVEAALSFNDLDGFQQSLAEFDQCLPQLANATSQLQSGLGGVIQP